MINLVEGSNSVVLTLTEKSTLQNPFFLFRFVGKQNFKEVVCIASDLSAYPYRYNEFNLIVKSSPNPLNGEIELAVGDEYNYFIYEQTNATNLDYKLAVKEVERGIMRMDVDNGEREEYQRDNIERKVYVRE